jgi:DNA-directed RNA polymerase subunit RPC12/RpoP
MLDKNSREFIEEQCESETYTTSDEDYITCPYCGYDIPEAGLYLDDCDISVRNNEDNFVIACDNCGKIFNCHAVITVSYTCDRLDEDILKEINKNE